MKSSCITFGSVLILACGIPARASNVFVSDSGNGTVVQFDSAGNQSVFASGLQNPQGLAFDGNGNLYVANSGAGTILRYDSGGMASVFASGLNDPAGLAFDDHGDLYVANQDAGTIMRYDSDGTGSVFASGLSDPQYLAFGGGGNLYVSGTHTVQEFDNNGNENWVMTPSESVYGIAFDGAGSLCLAFHNAGVIDVLGAGLLAYPSSVDCYQTMPLGLAFDQSGNVYATFQQLAYFGIGTGLDTVMPGAVMEFSPGGYGTVLATGLADPEYIAVENAQSTPIQFIPEPSTWAIMILGWGALVAWRRTRVIPLRCLPRSQRIS